jgi:prepilin-type N-terminal cleavage/methylation domain-containing protein
MTPNGRRGFTLIELLVVIAIIPILIAIVLPNSLEAMVRARVAKSRAELHALDQALARYYLDRDTYVRRDVRPPQGCGAIPDPQGGPGTEDCVCRSEGKRSLVGWQ